MPKGGRRSNFFPTDAPGIIISSPLEEMNLASRPQPSIGHLNCLALTKRIIAGWIYLLSGGTRTHFPFLGDIFCDIWMYRRSWMRGGSNTWTGCESLEIL